MERFKTPYSNIYFIIMGIVMGIVMVEMNEPLKYRKN
jgi:hypothetical protein